MSRPEITGVRRAARPTGAGVLASGSLTLLALASAGLALSPPAATAASAQESTPAHPAPAPGGAAGAEGISEVTTRVLCPCGTCVNQTLHECTCGVAASERGKIAEAVASGRSPESVVQEYIDRYGVQILTTPEKSGLNLVGWLVPFAVTLAALGALTWILRGWMRTSSRPGAGLTPAPAESRPGRDSRDYREQLERELRDIEV